MSDEKEQDIPTLEELSKVGTEHWPDGRSSLAVLTGSLPVSSANALAEEWDDKARGYMKWAAGASTPSQRERIEAVSDTLWGCARQLRRQIAAAHARQPEENTSIGQTDK